MAGAAARAAPEEAASEVAASKNATRSFIRGFANTDARREVACRECCAFTSRFETVGGLGKSGWIALGVVVVVGVVVAVVAFAGGGSSDHSGLDRQAGAGTQPQTSVD